MFIVQLLSEKEESGPVELGVAGHERNIEHK
jgi:hypothetical protein